MEQEVLMPLNLQLFAEGGEEDNANNQNQEVVDTSKDTKANDKKETKAKVKKIRLYDLRHTFVTTMMSENWELYHISKTLGHSNYSTTVNKYGHITKQIRKEMALTTDKFY